MENVESNRVNMIQTTAGYCDGNSGATAGIGAFAGVLGTVKNKLVLINGLDQIGMGTTTGVTMDTNLLRATMSNIGIKCASAVVAFANSTNNNTLKAKVNYTISDLNKMKKDEVDDVCQTIHDETNTNIAGAGPFGIVAGDVTDLQTAIDLYRASIQKPRQAIISRSQAIDQMKEQIGSTVQNLLGGQMDKMVNTLKTANADFYSGYYKAREVIDLGATTGKVRGTVTDVNDVQLANVRFTITKTGTGEVVGQTETDAAGKFGISNLAPGDYDFTWELAGYVTQTETNVHLAAGKELKRRVKLVRV